MSLSAAASILLLLHALVLTLILLAAMVSTTTALSVPAGDDVNTTVFTNGSSATSSSPTASGNFEMYYCFLCTERHPLLIHYCPIYWDECHLNCWDDTPPSTAPPVQGKECYVMKLYMSGRYVIVQRLSCDGIASCFLTCGGGELDDRRQNVAMGTTVPATTTAAILQQGSFVPFELCNTQVNAPPSAGVVVPAAGGGGARRRS